MSGLQWSLGPGLQRAGPPQNQRHVERHGPKGPVLARCIWERSSGLGKRRETSETLNPKPGKCKLARSMIFGKHQACDAWFFCAGIVLGGFA